MLEAGRGSGGASRQFYLRHRTAILSAVLSVVGIATGTATANAMLQDASTFTPMTMGAGAVLAALCCYFQFRHVPLAVLAAIAPLPGLILAAPVSGGPAFGFIPYLAYVMGFAVAVLQADAVVARVLEGRDCEYPWRPAVAAVGLMAVLALVWFWRTRSEDAAIQAIVDAAGASAAAAILVPLGASLLHFDENFVARANRVREWRCRLCQSLTFLTIPRWAISLTGIVCVFLALGWFGAEPITGVPGPAALLRLLVSVLLLGFTAERLAGGWREALAVVLVAGAVALVMLWGMALARRGPFSYPATLEAAFFSVFLAFFGGRMAWVFRRLGDDPLLARRRAIEEGSSSLVLAAAGGLAFMLPGLLFLPRLYLIYPVAMLFAAGGGALFAPAVASAIEWLLPRRHTAEEFFGKR